MSARIVCRRDALGIMSAAGAVALTGGKLAAAGDRAESRAAALALDCVATPQQTEGPYFLDERLNRADIRSDPVTGIVKEGLPLRLRINVTRVNGGACAPLEGAMVDVWQCDATGVYSDVRDFQGLFDTRGQKFLRGYQTSGRNGAAEFLTIYPGWYSGRTVHIHFKVRVSGAGAQNHEFTSQLYFDDAITDQVFAAPPYNAKGPRDTRNGQDGIFRRGQSGSKLMLHLVPDVRGYIGAFNLGLRVA